MITYKKLNNILNKFQMFPLGMWWKHFQNVIGKFQMLHKCSHRFQVKHMIWEHLECTQAVIGG